MHRAVIVGVLLLCACGQPATPTTASRAAEAAHAARAPADIAARIAALPAPYANGDYENGRKVFAQCRSCHTVGAGEPNRVGPHLHGVFGRKAGSVADFGTYSVGLEESGIVWDPVGIDRWVANPRDLIPVNNMIFPGVRREEDRRDLVAYLAVETAD